MFARALGLVVLLAGLLLGAAAHAQFDVRAYGALGDGATDDTAAFQSAWNAAKAVQGRMIVPPANAGQCYVVTSINATMANGIVVAGMGDGSRLCANTSGNWWDLSGSSNIAFAHLSIASFASAVPSNIFLWATVNPNVVLHDLSFEHVNADFKASTALIYGYGYRRLSCANSTWTQRYNGPVVADRSLQTTVLRADALKSVAVASAYVTLASGPTNALQNVLTNCNITEYVGGYGAGNHSNDTAFACVGCGNIQVVGGRFGSTGTSAVVLWSNVEAVSFTGTAFDNPSGAIGDSKCFLEFGGGTIGQIAEMQPWYSQPDVGGAYHCIGAPVGLAGGIQELVVTAPNPGGNFNGVPFVGLAPGFTCPTPLNPWISDSSISALAGANAIVTCGSIIRTTLGNKGIVNGPLSGFDPCEVIGATGAHCTPGGTIEKWGVTAAIPPGGYVAVTFPVPFPNQTDNCTANAGGLWPPGTPGSISLNIGGPANIALINTSATSTIPAASWVCKGH